MIERLICFVRGHHRWHNRKRNFLTCAVCGKLAPKAAIPIGPAAAGAIPQGPSVNQISTPHSGQSEEKK